MDEQSCKCHCHVNNHGLPPGSNVMCRCMPNCIHCNPYYDKQNKEPMSGMVTMPMSLYNEITQMAQEQEISESEFVRRCMKIGIMVAKATQEADTSFIIRQGEREREIVFT